MSKVPAAILTSQHRTGLQPQLFQKHKVWVDLSCHVCDKQESAVFLRTRWVPWRIYNIPCLFFSIFEACCRCWFYWLFISPNIWHLELSVKCVSFSQCNYTFELSHYFYDFCLIRKILLAEIKLWLSCVLIAWSSHPDGGSQHVMVWFGCSRGLNRTPAAPWDSGNDFICTHAFWRIIEFLLQGRLQLAVVLVVGWLAWSTYIWNITLKNTFNCLWNRQLIDTHKLGKGANKQAWFRKIWRYTAKGRR